MTDSPITLKIFFWVVEGLYFSKKTTSSIIYKDLSLTRLLQFNSTSANLYNKDSSSTSHQPLSEARLICLRIGVNSSIATSTTHAHNAATSGMRAQPALPTGGKTEGQTSRERAREDIPPR
ncbi:unnamed protein product [Trichogramma brassicae]|uniref:Uncharacterized protein n=1 Tax=Trichogramma brassicae TaxID=86971 RepID=A0A6H5HRH6_9HYME|nr:unnamed protein product [Trichogramma brassicae]